MKIVLLGYMGSGKSIIGKNLSEKIGTQFIDLDTFIEECEDMFISDIFRKKGEIYFRKIEAVYLEKLLKKEENLIISLGGGTPCYGNNMKLILKNSISFYLKSNIATIFERLQNETSQRPIIAEIGKEHLKEFIAKHLFERGPFYEEANYTVKTDQQSVSEITNEIYQIIKLM